MKPRNLTVKVIITAFLLTNSCFASIQTALEQSSNFPIKIQKNTSLVIENMNKTIKTFNLENNTIISHATIYKLKECLKPFGYFHADITQQVVTEKNNTKTILFHISLGTPIIIQSIKINFFGKGKDNTVFTQLKKHPLLQPGDILNTDIYNQLKERIYKAASDNGFFDAKIKYNNIAINTTDNTANITIDTDTGSQYTIGETIFNKTYYSNSFLKKYITYNKGDKYNIKLLNKTQQNFINAPYFAQAILTPETRNKKHNTIPIKTTITTLPRKRYTISLGYDKLNMLYLTSSLYNNRLYKDGTQLKSTIQISKPEKNIFSELTFPSDTSADTYYGISAGFSRMLRPNGKSSAAKGVFSKKIISANNNLTYAINILKERYSYSDLPKTTANMIYPSLNWNYTSSLKKNNITQSGYSISSQLAGTINKLAHGNHFAQLIISARSLYTLANNFTRIVLRGSYGVTSIKNILNLPLSMQLYAGGTGSIRGYGFHSIPASPARNMFTASSELQQKIYKQLYVTAFYDTGNVANHNLIRDAKKGAGMGLAIISPIGTFELSFAKALSIKRHKISIQFSMEPPI
jgi:translocation and assembly module TamA